MKWMVRRKRGVWGKELEEKIIKKINENPIVKSDFLYVIFRKLVTKYKNESYCSF